MASDMSQEMERVKRVIVSGDATRLRQLIVENAEILHAAVDDGGEPSTVLHLAASEGKVDILQILLKAGADANAINYCGQTALHEACHEWKCETSAMAQLLLDAGAYVDARDEDGETPLHIAANTHHHDACAVLLQRGADPRVESKRGLIPLASMATDRAETQAFFRTYEILRRALVKE